MLFPLRSGLHTQMHPSPFSGRPSNFSFTICQSKPHFCAKSLAWKERHESQVVDLSDQAWLQDFYQNLSLASNGSQTGSKKWHMHFQLSGNQWLSSPHITACQLIQASKPHSIFSSYHKYTIQRKKEKQLRTSSLFHPFPATLLPLAPAQTAMCQHLALPPVAVSGVAGATATNQGIGLWQPIIITATHALVAAPVSLLAKAAPPAAPQASAKASAALPSVAELQPPRWAWTVKKCEKKALGPP